MAGEDARREIRLKFLEVIDGLRVTALHRGETVFADALTRCLEASWEGVAFCPVGRLLALPPAGRPAPTPAMAAPGATETRGPSQKPSSALSPARMLDLILSALERNAQGRGDRDYVEALRACRELRHGSDRCPLHRVYTRPPGPVR